AAVTPEALDHLLGAILDASDSPFNELLALGFRTSMEKEWAWRVDRGESLRNLEAFRGLLERPGDPPREA
ncbi:MAG: YbjN domain-containing protein, partial [Tetrasphaera sp.]|nr:YbjN domain-containing protein [Tetrasphaera sp.]